MFLSVIIPVFNEKRTVMELLNRLDKVKLPNNIKKEVIIIDDGSCDGTSELLQKLVNNYRIIFQKQNRGKGFAVKCGLEEAKGDIIIIQDADLEYSPLDIPFLLRPFVDDNASVIYGSRFLNPKHIPRYRVYFYGNKFLSFLFSLFYWCKITDVETGYKLFKKDVIKDMVIKAKGFELEIELTTKILKKGYKIKELPISYSSRSFNDGKKIGWQDGVKAIFYIIKYKFID